MTLRTRILLLSSGTAVLVGVASLLLIQGLMRRQTEAVVLRASSRTNSVLNQFITNHTEQLARSTGLVAEQPGTRGVLGTDGATISDYLADVTSTIGADWVVIANADGSIKGSSNKDLFAPGEKLHDRFGASKCIAGGAWSGIERINGKVMVAATKPIVIGDYVKATITAGITFDDRLLSELAQASRVQIVLLDGGKPLASSIQGSRQVGGTGTRVRFLNLGEETLVGTETALSGVQGGSSVSFIAYVKESEILSPFHALWQGLLAVLGMATLISILLGFSLANSVTKPLGRIVVAARELQAGGWPGAIASGRNDEIGLLESVFDETTVSLKASKARLLELLEVDPLTELYNHRAFRERLEAMVWKGREDRIPISLAILDVDDFETFNQAAGTAQGDRALRAIADLLRERSQDGMVFGRFGGNEFAIAAISDDAEGFCEFLLKDVRDKTPLTASIGLASLGGQLDRPDLLVLAAQMAVGQAKQAGRNRVRIFESFEAVEEGADLKSFLQPGSYAAVRALAEAVDAKDEYTRGHSRRVAEYAKALAEAIGCDAGFVDLVYTAGTLHDVGKIGVPDNVLKKAGKLTEDEFQHIARHPELGEKIVSQIPQLKDALPGVRHHHERWDGKGYPDGLSGDEIPLIARILAVADAYDAMTSDRPYRPGMPIDQALDEIKLGMGKQFDPKLVAPFVEMFSVSVQRAA